MVWGGVAPAARALAANPPRFFLSSGVASKACALAIGAGCQLVLTPSYISRFLPSGGLIDTDDATI